MEGKSRSNLNLDELDKKFDELLNSYTKEEINEWAKKEGLEPILKPNNFMKDIQHATTLIESVDYNHSIGRVTFEDENIQEVLEDFEILLDALKTAQIQRLNNLYTENKL